jgi:hypothetical protein
LTNENVALLNVVLAIVALCATFFGIGLALGALL